MCECCEEHTKKCSQCGQTIIGTGIMREGKLFCSEECAKVNQKSQ